MQKSKIEKFSIFSFLDVKLKFLTSWVKLCWIENMSNLTWIELKMWAIWLDLDLSSKCQLKTQLDNQSILAEFHHEKSFRSVILHVVTVNS